jgi:5-(carboxyamino)imidazole ribonucleotide synthase
VNIGIIGAGQLARMLALAAYEIGLQCTTFSSALMSSTKDLIPCCVGEYNDNPVLEDFLKQVDVVTFETENIPAAFVKLIGEKANALPNSASLMTFQNRALEKQLFNQLGVPTNQFVIINSEQDLKIAAEKLHYPFVIKTQTSGYDGKGQAVINNADELINFNLSTNVEYIAEQWVDFGREVSIVGVRDQQGNMAFYDLCENVHRDGILRKTTVKHDDPYFAKATDNLTKLMQHFNYVGVMALEMFQHGDELLANEVAPRVHNTGHWTIHGALTSQFENHVRAIAGLPLGPTASCGYSVMFNFIGEIPAAAEVLKIPGAFYVDYLKEARPGRKLGHATIVNAEFADLQAGAEILQQLL